VLSACSNLCLKTGNGANFVTTSSSPSNWEIVEGASSGVYRMRVVNTTDTLFGWDDNCPTNSVTGNSCQGCMYTDDRNKALTNADVQWTIDFSTGSISVCRSMTKLLTQHLPILNSLFLILTNV